MRRLPAVLGAVVVAVVAAVGIWIALPKATCACEPPPGSPVDGLVVEVTATGLTNVTGFALRPYDYPTTLVFTMGPLENPTAFSPGHLKEHQATGTPVRVWFSLQANGQRVVYRLEDAPEPSPSVAAPASSP
jgi:hypothetical protein